MPMDAECFLGRIEKMRFLMVFLCAAMPLAAQTLDPRYEVLGQFEGEFDGAQIVLSSLYDREKDRSMVRLRNASGFETVNVNARAIGEDGKPTSPSLSLTIGPVGQGAGGTRADVFYSDASGYYVSDGDIGGRVSLDAFEMDDMRVTFSMEATLTPVKRADDGFAADPERSVLNVTGRYSGTMTDVD
jgi:hypothetical protein